MAAKRKRRSKRRGKRRHAKAIAGSTLPRSERRGEELSFGDGRLAAFLLVLLLSPALALVSAELLRLAYWAGAQLPGMVSVGLRAVLLFVMVGLGIAAIDRARRPWRDLFVDTLVPVQLCVVGLVVFGLGHSSGLRLAHELEATPPLLLEIGELAQHPEARFVEFEDAVLRPELHVEFTQEDPHTESEEWFTATAVTGPAHRKGEPVPLWVLRRGKGEVVRELPRPIRGAVGRARVLGGAAKRAGLRSSSPPRELRPSSEGYEATILAARRQGERVLWWISLALLGFCLLLGGARALTR